MPAMQDPRAIVSQPSGAGNVVISVDAMGGDHGAAAVVAGVALAAADLASAHFVLHGPEAELVPLVARHPGLAGRCTLRHAAEAVTMADKPSQVMRSGQATSMWSAIESVREGEAPVAVSCGNTGALMAVAMIRLRRLPGVKRPAIACLWPSYNPSGFNVMLDVGADVKADADDLMQYAMMGASYARNGLGVMRPRVGLLNVGTEEHKGRPELKAAAELLANAAEAGGFDYVGFVEGGDLPSDRVDVIVTDGFTGNIALKTGEGTAKLVSALTRASFNSGWLARLGGLLSLPALKRLQARIDPRRVNGGVFLGLNGIVVKSHGSADATGVAAALRLGCQLAQSGFRERIAARVALASRSGQDAAQSEAGGGNPT